MAAFEIRQKLVNALYLDLVGPEIDISLKKQKAPAEFRFPCRCFFNHFHGSGRGT